MLDPLQAEGSIACEGTQPRRRTVGAPRYGLGALRRLTCCLSYRSFGLQGLSQTRLQRDRPQDDVFGELVRFLDRLDDMRGAVHAFYAAQAVTSAGCGSRWAMEFA